MNKDDDNLYYLFKNTFDSTNEKKVFEPKINKEPKVNKEPKINKPNFDDFFNEYKKYVKSIDEEKHAKSVKSNFNTYRLERGLISLLNTIEDLLIFLEDRRLKNQE